MEKYEFEYTDQKTMFAILLGCLGLFFVGMIGLFYLRTLIGPTVSFVLVLGTPFVVFWWLKGRIRRKGTARLRDNSLALVLNGKPEVIDFRALQYYGVTYFSGPTLTLKLAQGQKTKVRAHSSFCNAAGLDDFCDDLGMVLANYGLRHGTGLVRKPSDFEHKLMKPALIVLSVVLLGSFLYSLFARHRLPSMFAIPAMAVFLLWKGYITTQRKAKAREI